MLTKGVMPIPPAKKTAGLVLSLCRTIEPEGPSISIFDLRGIAFREFLKAVSLILAAIKRLSSKGAEVREKILLLPSSSVWGGFISLKVIYWPALYSNPAGFSKVNCMVPSATSPLSKSFIVYLATVLLNDIINYMKLPQLHLFQALKNHSVHLSTVIFFLVITLMFAYLLYLNF